MEGKENSDEKQVENVFTEESSEKQQALSVLPSYIKSYSTTQIESTTFEYSWKIDQFKLVCKILDTLCSAPFPENGKYMIQMNIIRKSKSPNEDKLLSGNNNTSNIFCNSCHTNRSFYCNYCRNTNSTVEKNWFESLNAQIYMRTNTPFFGSCTVMNSPKLVQSKTVAGHIEDMTLLMETSDLDYIYTDTLKIHCKFEIFHTITNKAIHKIGR
ncbi:PREDICTED: uncharacterized protein LOC105460072, partial [Wasmannia auropunctata]|uniref:uncharacterized protein LOC105460072 n=1 Tax=Wasmannia auropunctata TaxID=64793 RepID=UPI0005EF0613